jgi:protein-S-isoprenylcysteine O-methyltransferase Ste14
MGLLTRPWRRILLYAAQWTWVPAATMFCFGIAIYVLSVRGFSKTQLGGVPEVVEGNDEQSLVTTGIRSRVRHPVYLGHLCEMLAWSVGSGLAVTYALTGFAVITGAIMIRMEDVELEDRFGQQFRAYRDRVPAVLPRPRSQTVS